MLKALGSDVRGAGVRLVRLESDHAVRVTIDSAPKNPFALVLLLNLSSRFPRKAVYSDIIGRFGQYTADALVLAAQIINVSLGCVLS